jgi:PAS domain S-box-containing protein
VSHEPSPEHRPVVPPGTPEERLARTEERLRLLLDAARDYAIFSMDTERRVDYWSTGAERVFGYKENQILGLSGDVVFTPEDRALGQPEKEASEALSRGRSADERWHMRRDGSRFYASGMMWPLKAADGRVLGFVKIARDLTSQKLTEERLRASHIDLEQRVKERTAALDSANEELRVANEQLRVGIEERQQEEAVRREAVRRFSTVQEEERLRLSRELHDQLGQDCAALTLGLHAMECSGAEAGRRLEELKALAEKISSEVHSVAVRLRPTALEDVGLQGALESYTAVWTRRTGIPVELHAANVARFPPELEVALYRIVQEALTNVMKHAAAKRVSILLEQRRGEMRVVVEDDGRGFDTEREGTKVGRLGLLGMNERAAEFGGEVLIESSIGRGTTVFVRVPLPPVKVK